MRKTDKRVIEAINTFSPAQLIEFYNSNSFTTDSKDTALYVSKAYMKRLHDAVCLANRKQEYEQQKQAKQSVLDNLPSNAVGRLHVGDTFECFGKLFEVTEKVISPNGKNHVTAIELASEYALPLAVATFDIADIVNRFDIDKRYELVYASSLGKIVYSLDVFEVTISNEEISLKHVPIDLENGALTAITTNYYNGVRELNMLNRAYKGTILEKSMDELYYKNS